MYTQYICNTKGDILIAPPLVPLLLDTVKCIFLNHFLSNADPCSKACIIQIRCCICLTFEGLISANLYETPCKIFQFPLSTFFIIYEWSSRVVLSGVTELYI